MLTGRAPFTKDSVYLEGLVKVHNFLRIAVQETRVDCIRLLFAGKIEISSAWLRHVPGFASLMIHMKHGAGDRAGGYRKRHADFDLTLVGGDKDKRRLIARGLGTTDNVRIGGYAKFELKAQRRRFFSDDKPVLLYNPHFDAALSSWVNHGPAVLAALESVSLVVPFEEDTALEAVLQAKPDVYVKGGDYQMDAIPEGQAVLAYGGQVAAIAFEHDRSTTRILAKVRMHSKAD